METLPLRAFIYVYFFISVASSYAAMFEFRFRNVCVMVLSLLESAVPQIAARRTSQFTPSHAFGSSERRRKRFSQEWKVTPFHPLLRRKPAFDRNTRSWPLPSTIETARKRPNKRITSRRNAAESKQPQVAIRSSVDPISLREPHSSNSERHLPLDNSLPL